MGLRRLEFIYLKKKIAKREATGWMWKDNLYAFRMSLAGCGIFTGGSKWDSNETGKREEEGWVQANGIKEQGGNVSSVKDLSKQIVCKKGNKREEGQQVAI